MKIIIYLLIAMLLARVVLSALRTNSSQSQDDSKQPIKKNNQNNIKGEYIDYEELKD